MLRSRLILILLLVTFGCSRPSKPQNPSVESTGAIDHSVSEVQSELDQPKSPIESAREEQAKDETTSIVQERIEPSENPTTIKSLAEIRVDEVNRHQASWERYLLAIDHGVIAIDFRVTIEGASPSKESGHVEKELMAQFRKGEDGTLLWEELLKHDWVTGGMFANVRPNDDRQKQELLGLYDVDRNGEVDEKELHAFLTRGLVSRGLFILDEANRFRDLNRERSSTFLRLDVDRDGVLSRSELASSVRRIQSMDSNADHVVSFEESQVIDPEAERFVGQRQRLSSPRMISWSRLGHSKAIQELIERFGEEKQIPAAHWSKSPQIFEALDQNRNDRISREELGEIANLTSDWVVGINFPSSRLQVEKSEGHVQFLEVDNGALVTSKRKEEWREKAGIRLRIRMGDSLSSENLEGQIARIASPLGVTKEKSAPINEASGSSENRLSAEMFDENGDNKIEWRELEAGVLRKAALTSCVIRVRLLDVPDAWFSWLDQDWNGFLSESEILSTYERLNRLSTASDSEIAPESLPVHLDVLVARQFGDDDPFTDQFSRLRMVRQEDASLRLPEWFLAMDSNGDGVITVREFLGDAKAFEAIDRDQNGQLDLRDMPNVDSFGS